MLNSCDQFFQILYVQLLYPSTVESHHPLLVRIESQHHDIERLWEFRHHRHQWKLCCWWLPVINDKKTFDVLKPNDAKKWKKKNNPKKSPKKSKRLFGLYNVVSFISWHSFENYVVLRFASSYQGVKFSDKLTVTGSTENKDEGGTIEYVTFPLLPASASVAFKLRGRAPKWFSGIVTL